MAIRESILNAKVVHKRITPKKNSFLYKQYYIFLKAREDWHSNQKLFSIDKFNLFSFFFRKYGKKNGENPYFYALGLLKKRCENTDWLKEIFVVSQPSLLGWAFNPVSFWFYLDQDEHICAVLSEVNNTFGEHHKYLAHNDDFSPISPYQVLKAKKVFYVSPFYEVQGEYEFQFLLTERSLGVWIDYIVDGKKTLLTSITGSFQDCTDKNLLIKFFQIPFSNLKTVLLIHWQALIIWLKGIKYVKRKKHMKRGVTRCR